MMWHRPRLLTLALFAGAINKGRPTFRSWTSDVSLLMLLIRPCGPPGPVRRLLIRRPLNATFTTYFPAPQNLGLGLVGRLNELNDEEDAVRLVFYGLDGGNELVVAVLFAQLVGVEHGPLHVLVAFCRVPVIRVAVHCREGLTLLIRNLMEECPRRRLLLYERRASSFRVIICTFPVRSPV